MTRTVLLLSFLLMGWAAVPRAQAGSTLSISVVHATNKSSGGGAPGRIAAILKRSLPYKHYRLMGSKSISLPARGGCSLAGYSIKCSGPQKQLRITVSKGGRSLINTTMNLRDGKPLILAGLPSGEGKQVLVFEAR